MRVFYSDRKNMARSFRTRAAVAPALFHACNGRSASRVARVSATRLAITAAGRG